MGGVTRARPILVLIGFVMIAGAPGCRSQPKAVRPGSGAGDWYVVRPGDNLWQISRQTGTGVDVIQRTNRIDNVHALQIGERLWIPRGDGLRRLPPGTPAVGAGADAATTLERRWGSDCSDAAREHGLDFEWPVAGRLNSAYGQRRGRPHDGIDIGAAKGTLIHAAEAGKVVYAADRLGAYGRVVIIKHVGSWATVYAHNDANLVAEGEFVERGDPIARVGRTGNASAPHLHFEIRRSNRPRDPVACLP
ncbi:M23 family metallopeptidase [Myxococcota bacterium]|nr:M23 family metallopeptidase [Myxococcota bacterium]MCZ7619262.1 M23 family metallopeptidase [Myxococcota bacterium]